MNINNKNFNPLKKIVILGLSIWLFVILLILNINATTIFEDDFIRANSGTIDAGISGGTWTETTETGSCSLSINSNTLLMTGCTDGKYRLEFNPTSSINGNVFIYYNYSQNTDNRRSDTLFWTGSGNLHDYLSQNENTPNFFAYFTGSWNNIQAMTSGTTYNIKHFLDYDSGRRVMWIDGVLKYNDTFYQTGSNLNEIMWDAENLNAPTLKLNTFKICQNECTPPINIQSNLTNNTYFNTNYVNIKLNETNGIKGNFSYSLNGSSFTSIQNNVNTTTLSLTSLSDGQYNITFMYNSTSENDLLSQVFTIDTTNPLIINNIPNEINTYSFNGSKFSCTDVNLLSCNISIDGFNKASGVDFELNHNWNLSYNITAIDLAGNQLLDTGVLFVNPLFYVYFNNNTDFVTNFSINGTNYNNYFNDTIYNYGLGGKSFVFSKTGYNDTIFSLTFNSTSRINQTIYVPNVYLIINLYDIENGDPAPNNNYSLLITNILTSESTSYNIINNNTLTIPNIYASNTNISLSVIFNSTITTTYELVTTRQNVSLSIYLTFQTIEQRVIQVLTGNLIVIPNTNVYLYRYIEGIGFVLQTIRTSNVLGQVTFDIVPLTEIYNICNTYELVEKCLSQITFQNALTDPYQIVHDVTINPIEKIFLNYISWSFSENKTNTSTQMTMTFNDAQSLVTSFCYNATRYTNNTQTFNQEYCNNNPTGQIVQTFSLSASQKITFNYYYYFEGEKNILGTYTTYGENSQLLRLNQASLFDILFLIIFFISIGFLLGFNNFSYYNIGILSIMLILFSIQAYFNENYIYVGVWGLLAIIKVVYYFVKVEG